MFPCSLVQVFIVDITQMFAKSLLNGEFTFPNILDFVFFACNSYLYLPGKCSISYVSPERHHGIKEDAGWRFLRGVMVVFDMLDVSRIHQGSYISIFKSLPAWEVLHLLCVSRVSSWNQRGCWLEVPERSHGGF